MCRCGFDEVAAKCLTFPRFFCILLQGESGDSRKVRVMQLPVHITLSFEDQRIQKDLSCLLSDTPLTILLESLKQANLMEAADKWSVETNRQGMRLGEQIWQISHAGRPLDLLQSLL